MLHDFITGKQKNVRVTLKISICLALLLSALTSFSQSGKSKSSPPNIIIILTDDMGYGDVGVYGGRFVPTPNIDRVAASGLKLNQYYSGAPICSPSRASILTGMYPGRWNFVTYLDNKKHNKDAGQVDFLDTKAPSIAKLFKNAGYATGHFGKWHMGGGRDVTDAPGFANYGFDEHVSTYESPEPDPAITATNWIWSDKDSIKRWERTRYFVDKTLDFMERQKGKPCFVNLWPDEVHTPWVPESEEAADAKNARQGEPAFKEVLKEYDVQIGRLLDGLKERGLAENTIVIFTSDNGALPTFDGRRSGGLRGSKLSLYEGGIRMPFLVSWPGHIAAGKTDERSEIHATDLLPTLTKLAGIRLPENYAGDGVDRSGVLLGKPSARNKEMFWEYGRNNIAYAYPKDSDRSPQLAVRSGEWKLLMNADGSGTELYNIVQDKAEKNNVAASHEKVVQQLRSKLQAWWKSLPVL